MIENYKISVIIPIFNAGIYLSRCLNSIINNTYRNLEIICVNDGSTDNSLSVLNSYAKSDNRIIVINQDNKGVSAARNAALDIATGDLLSFVDADDWIHLRFFEILVTSYRKSTSQIVCCKYLNTSGYIEDIDYNDFNRINTYVFHINDIMKNHITRKYLTARVYNCDIINHIRFYENLEVAEDNVFNLEVLKQFDNTMTLEYMDAYLYYYYDNELSASHKATCDMYISSIDWYLAAISENNNPFYNQGLAEQSIKSFLNCRYSCLFEIDKKQILRKLNVRKKECFGLIFKLPFKLRWIYFVFFVLPLTYRLFRITNDRTLIEYERKKKQELKELKKCTN